ncbi:hypothetical protein L228DRAFT_243546 [Xylona heveae TC161]|uniref:Protein kinase domain-containing protein n=1 Tax=Xylona heveae (strain CBS 132557 / TC161) TaxID=1328760 RepID=A0A165IFE0_XYLHT|nr:hypothetical protein L228DRAFT_243546 [Xylona heveae TC161]KZF24821.1 hypothetical protein L228DRAFT_243546 [Xylona heveae TC161]
MAGDRSPDYKALFLRAEEERRQEVELRRQAEERQRQAEEQQRQAEEQQRQAEEQQRQAEEQQRQAEERIRETTFGEFIQTCHSLLSRPLQVEITSHSTKGTIPPPTGKYCPTRLLPWPDCAIQQQLLFNSVCGYLQPAGEDPPQLFSPFLHLEGLGRRLCSRKLSSEKDLEIYERFAVEDHVHDIVAELCKIPRAQREFRLGDGVKFDNHSNTLDEVDIGPSETNDTSNFQNPRPDQFCIHRVNGTTNTLLTTVEYKPPHKLSVENLRAGLRPMNLWEEVVQRDTIPTDEAGKLKYNAELLASSVLAQEYHVMIQEGLEYSYVTNGFALVLLRVPYDDPSTLYYYHCEPNLDLDPEDDRVFRQPKSAIARVLCLCLMSFRSRSRGQAWRNAARARLHIWKTSFDHILSQIPNEELQRAPPDSGYIASEDTGSEYLPSSNSVSPTIQDRRIPTRSQTGCAPPDAAHGPELMDSSDSDTNHAESGRKRGFSQVESPSPRPLSRQSGSRNDPNSRNQQHAAQFCTQRCLIGLQQQDALDENCPNVELHRQGKDGNQHCITAERLVQLIKQQLDKDLDNNITPLGICGAYGAPFKITSVAYGYTIIGKGTTSRLWKEVSREAEVYQVLRKAQGSAVPVFLGAINLKNVYFLHGAGEIQHMLLMAYAGESTSNLQHSRALTRELSRSRKEIRNLGVVHQDLRPDNILWNSELERILIIDFHRSELDLRLMKKPVGSLKRSLCNTQEQKVKRLRVL